MKEGGKEVQGNEQLRERAIQIVEALRAAYRSTEGIFGVREEDKPERVFTRGIPQHALPHFLMNVCALDYNAPVVPIWARARRAYEDPATQFIFVPSLVVQRGLPALRRAMFKTGFYGRYPEKNASNLFKISTTLVTRYSGSIMSLLRMFDLDAFTLWQNRKKLGDLPSLTGPKVWPFFLRLLLDVAGVPLKNIDKIPIPVDVHILRTTERLLLRTNSRPDQRKAKEVRELWSQLLAGTSYYPLMIDRELWVLSREGCSGSDDQNECVKIDFCPVAKWCVFYQGKGV